ncbi:cubilin-like [Schistocerca cancellata]|uniref:cubilin-like n=1 Tax=Schistocerca cancellata TaxID=274614 RepID=UPI002117D52A|nr:cubilin-like [Schistocerca cancellata]
MDTTTSVTFRLLLVVGSASLGSCLGDQCSVVHYLAAGEMRSFPFRSGSQFIDNLHCIFSFSAPTDHRLTMAVSDLDMAPPSTDMNGKTSCVNDVLTIYDLTGGQLKAIGSYCGNNATVNPEFVLSSNVAVVSFVSNESSTPRRFTLTLGVVQQMQQVQQNGSTSEGQKEVETGTEAGQGNGEEGEGNGEEEGTGEEETTTETAEGEEETVTETGDGEGEEGRQ